MRRALVTGSCGLVGSAVAFRLLEEGWRVTGVDNGARVTYFGKEASVRGVLNVLTGHPAYEHRYYDVRNVKNWESFKGIDLIVHAAAQPSHDWAAKDPLTDFHVNARGTLQLLEAARKHCPETPFVFLSTNKVYGDAPNRYSFKELPTRFEFCEDFDMKGVDESCSIDASTHSLFGCSKAAADLYVQEYGRYFDMPTVCLRCGCLTGEKHSGVEQHGFLSYLVRQALRGRVYEVYGYGGKQVRDNLHADDVAEFCWRFASSPRKAVVYNLGGGYQNSVSVLEAIDMVTNLGGVTPVVQLNGEVRKGDHRVYYSDLSRVQRDYPGWQPTVSLPEMVKRIIMRWRGCDNNS